MAVVENVRFFTPHQGGRPTWAEVDLAALVENYRTMNSFLKGETSRIVPVIKADAYGHGAIPVARALAAQGATAFAVALVEEGVALRQGGISGEILVLQGVWPGQEIESIDHRLTATVYSPDGVRRLDRASRDLAQAVPVHLKIDTGMARLGVSWETLGPVLEALRGAEHVRLRGTFSHLACAEEEDPYFTLEQIRRFEHSLQCMRTSGFDPGEVHLANSSGLLYCDRLRTMSARPGITLYGYAPAPSRCPVRLKRSLSLKTRIGRVCTIEPGSTVGYNRRFKASRPTRAATLPIGYADGYRHALTGRGRVIIRDRWAEVLGAVAMDMIVADITDIPEAGEGDEVILLGSSPSCRIDAQDWADLLGTIPYEILCAISPRVPRVYAGL